MPRVLPLLPRRNYGIELETHSGSIPDMTAHEGFGSKHDCSIQGLEYVSGILRGRIGLRKIRNFMRAGVNMRVNRSCGFHAHFCAVSDLTDTQRFLIAAAYMATEDQWFSRVAPSRRNNSYCYRWEGDSSINDCLEGATYREDFYDFCRSYDRYNWLNIAAYRDHRTFENRLHQGTWNFTKVKNWLALNLRFIKAASRIRSGGDIATFKDRAHACLLWAESSDTRILRAITA